MAARLTAYIVALIVSVTFIAGLIVGAQRADDGPIDLMVVNGRVYTADGDGGTAEAVAIQGNRILRVGSTREIQRLRRPQTVVIDAKGGTVLPGFTEVGSRLFDFDTPPAEAPVFGPSPAPTREAELAALRRGVEDAHRRGITSIQTVGGVPLELEMYDELRRQDALSLRVYAALAVSPASSESDLEALDELRERFPDDPVLKAGVAEISFEGDDLTAEKLTDLVTELDKRNWQIALQASGDRAVSMALAAYRRALATNPAPPRGRRHRIDAVDIVGPVDFEPFDELGIVSPAGAEADSLVEMIEARTRIAAWASFDEHRKGSLARDMLADVVVMSTDILSHPTERLGDVEVSVTIFDGKVVFQRAPKPGDSDN